MSSANTYEAVIGLEVHIQLQTQSKLFCGDANKFGAEPNTNISAFTLALPGTLPVINQEAVQLAIKLGLACNSTINPLNYFARKHYFYPDSPKGFQTTQDAEPIILGGELPIIVNGKTITIAIHHAHLEEDAGKSIHDLSATQSMIDLNRAGTPLVELVTMPCLHSADEAAAFVLELRRIVRWLGISDGNMEEGSIRADVNVSLRPTGTTTLGTRVEVKNVNSVRFIKKAIEFEIDRLTKMLDNGETVIQQTRSFDASNDTTFALREKEDANDYRYMPEPDLPAITITQQQIDAVAATMPELPMAKEMRYMADYSFTSNIAKQLTEDADTNEYFEALSQQCNNPKTAANWLTGPIAFYCNENNLPITAYPIRVASIAEIIKLIDNGSINYQIATTKLLPLLYNNVTANPLEICQANALIIEKNNDALAALVNEVLQTMPDKVAEYKKGKKGLMGLFTGQIMKKTKGMGDAKTINELLTQILEN
jgi:aspartyl-tRNA(Asn)/glutamyl-tRNA(Gln) amidotransferase subunit B